MCASAAATRYDSPRRKLSSITASTSGVSLVDRPTTNTLLLRLRDARAGTYRTHSRGHRILRFRSRPRWMNLLAPASDGWGCVAEDATRSRWKLARRWIVWRVEICAPPRQLRLAAEMRLPGRAWLYFELLSEGNSSTIMHPATFGPVGCRESHIDKGFSRRISLNLPVC